MTSLTIWAMRTFLIMTALVGCGDDNQTVDAAVKDAAIDAAPVTLDCPAYCVLTATRIRREMTVDR
jgi:hypothetical protein